MKQKLTILIASCDAYRDTWEPFFYFFEKFWSDCPYNIVLMNNKYQIDKKGVKNLNIQQKNWGNEMMQALNLISTQYVLYIQDDYFLTSFVNTKYFNQFLNFAEEIKLWYLRLFPYPGERQEEDSSYEISWEKIKKIKKGTPFISSLQLAIRDKDVLLSLLREWEWIWNFEMNSHLRTLKIEKDFYSLAKKDYLTPLGRVYPINYLCTWIRRWKRHKKAFLYCKEFGISLDLQYRKVENFWDLLKKERIYNKAPYCVRKYLQKILW